MDKMQRVRTPDGVSKLLEELWMRHKAGLKQPENNVYWVDFPPLTEEEQNEINAREEAKRNAKEQDDKPEDLYGSWI